MFYYSHIELSFFRGFENLKLELPNDFILIYGNNGSGKTNFLEAINLLSLTKSFRPVTDKELTHWNQDFYFVHAEIKNHPLLTKISCNYLKNKGKKIFHNDNPIQKFSTHIGLLPCVSLTPDDSDIIKDSAKRRKWFNLLFSQGDKEYLNTLQKYENALQQRNILLKSEKPFKELEPWTYQLCLYGKILLHKRKLYFEKLFKIYSQIHEALGAWDVSKFLYAPNCDYENINQAITHYEKHLKTDYLYGFTTIGAHKDNVQFLIDDQPLKHFGSQGQQKTFIINLKLAEYEFLSNHQKAPILLLDDVFEKLDKQRIAVIAEFLHSHQKGQILVTHPQFLDFHFKHFRLQIQNHQIIL